MNKLSIRRRQFLLMGAAGVAGVGALLSGCGFRLRGSLTYPFQTLYIAGQNQSPVALLLPRLFGGQLQLTQSAQQAQVILTVLRDSTERVASALGSGAQVREVELRQFFDFTLTTPETAGQPDPITILTTRFVGYNESQATAKESEIDILYRDMRSDTAMQVMRRLAAYKPQ